MAAGGQEWPYNSLAELETTSFRDALAIQVYVEEAPLSGAGQGTPPDIDKHTPSAEIMLAGVSNFPAPTNTPSL